MDPIPGLAPSAALPMTSLPPSGAHSTQPFSGCSSYGTYSLYSAPQPSVGSGVAVPPAVSPIPRLSTVENVSHPFDTTGQVGPPGVRPRVTATLWEDENSLCFQVEAKGVCVARREDNHMINGTKLLNVAGMTRGRRDGILKSEKVRHVVKLGPMHLKGVWIPFDRALDFANKEKITEQLYPLFVHDIGALLYHPSNSAQPRGSGGPGAANSLSALDRRRTESRYLTARQTPQAASIHHHSMSNPVVSTVPPQQQQQQEPSSGRPEMDRAHTFPTPPASGSSVMGAWGVSYAPGSGSNGPVQENHPLSNDSDLSNTRSMPTTPASTPPLKSIQGTLYFPTYEPYLPPQLVYSVKAERKSQYQPQMLFGGPLQSATFPMNDMAPSSKADMSDPRTELKFVSGTTRICAAARDEEDDQLPACDDSSNEQSNDIVPRAELHDQIASVVAKTDSSSMLTEEVSECSDSTQSGDSSPRGWPLSRDRDGRKAALVEGLMEYFSTFFATYCRSPGFTQAAGENGNSQRGSDQAVQREGSNRQPGFVMNSSATSSKRRLQENQGEDEQDQEEGDRPQRKRPKRDHFDDAAASLKLACPYFKRNRRKYQGSKLCVGPGWETVHRLKEHLYRSHRLPIRCPRCCETFENEPLLLDHQRAEVPCEVQGSQPVEGFDDLQEKRLRSRKKERKDMSEEDKWRKVYQILFPTDDESKIPSAYYDYIFTEELAEDGSGASAELARYEAYLRRELPSSLRRELESRVDQLLECADETLKSQLPNTFRDLQLRLFQDYLQLRKNQQTSASTADGHQSQSLVERTDIETQIAKAESSAVDQSYLMDELALLRPIPWCWDVDGFDATIYEMPYDGTIPSDSGYGSNYAERSVEKALGSVMQSSSVSSLHEGYSENTQNGT